MVKSFENENFNEKGVNCLDGVKFGVTKMNDSNSISKHQQRISVQLNQPNRVMINYNFINLNYIIANFEKTFFFMF